MTNNTAKIKTYLEANKNWFDVMDYMKKIEDISA